MFAQKYNSPRPGKDGLPGKRMVQQIDESLFNLETDVGETTNVAQQHPQVVARLKALAEQIRGDLGEGRQAGPGRRPLRR